MSAVAELLEASVVVSRLLLLVGERGRGALLVLRPQHVVDEEEPLGGLVNVFGLLLGQLLELALLNKRKHRVHQLQQRLRIRHAFIPWVDYDTNVVGFYARMQVTQKVSKPGVEGRMPRSVANPTNDPLMGGGNRTKGISMPEVLREVLEKLSLREGYRSASEYTVKHVVSALRQRELESPEFRALLRDVLREVLAARK
jgi:hypothetical protein